MKKRQAEYETINELSFAHHANVSVLASINVNEKTNLAQVSDFIDQPINESLNLFQSHGLHDLDAANLMNRVDSKFILPISFLPDLLAQLNAHYSVLEINNKRISTYHNQYFDTPQMALYQDHHNGKLNRYKVRRRRYVDTNTSFLEVKLKNNKKRTIKSRIKLTGKLAEYSRCAKFIDEQMQINVGNMDLTHLDISQQGGYKRIALANEAQAERLTLDFDLWYQDRRGNNKVKLPGFFIAELKQNKKSKRSPFYQLISANHIFPTSFSKYCIGCALLYKSSIKSNRFKSILSRIEKFNQIKPTAFLKSN